MASLVCSVLLHVLLLSMAAGHSSAIWCICKGLNDAALQKTLDYACGAGADCNPIRTNGPCYSPTSVRAHCNYAVNSFFQKKGQTAGSCDFAGTAAVTTSDPSYSGCTYPSSASSSSSSTSTPTTPGMRTPTMTPPSTTTPVGSGGTPFITNPSNGILGSGGLGPSSAGINTDTSHAQKTVPFLSTIGFLSLSSLLILFYGMDLFN